MTDARYELFFNRLMKEEGFISDDPDDSGGLTKYGISKQSYPQLDIRNLTREDASKIYKSDYHDIINISLINDPKLAYAIFDCAVNCGVRTSAKMIQIALNTLYKANLKIDGRIGIQTISAINSNNAALLLFLFVSMRSQYYIELVKSRPSNQKFLDGWLRRNRRTLMEDMS